MSCQRQRRSVQLQLRMRSVCCRFQSQEVYHKYTCMRIYAKSHVYASAILYIHVCFSQVRRLYMYIAITEFDNRCFTQLDTPSVAHALLTVPVSLKTQPNICVSIYRSFIGLHVQVRVCTKLYVHVRVCLCHANIFACSTLHRLLLEVTMYLQVLHWPTCMYKTVCMFVPCKYICMSHTAQALVGSH